DPDGSFQTYAYDDDGLLTDTTTKGGLTEHDSYKFGRAVESDHSDGEVIQLQPLEIQHLFDPELTSDPSAAPVAPSAANRDTATLTTKLNATTTHHVTLTLDEHGQVVKRTDDLGPVEAETVQEPAAPTVITPTAILPPAEVATVTQGDLVRTETSDIAGNVVKITDALSAGGTVTAYDPVFNVPTRVTDELGHQTVFTLDVHGNVRFTRHVVDA